MIKYFLALLLVVNVNFAFTQNADTSRYAILPFDEESMRWYLPAKSVSDSLTEAEIQQVLRLVDDCVRKFNDKQLRYFDSLKAKKPGITKRDIMLIRDFRRYKQQIVCIKDSTGRKIVWVNCLCDVNMTNWRKEIPIIADGGTCFFNVKIDLLKGDWFDMFVNSVA